MDSDVSAARKHLALLAGKKRRRINDPRCKWRPRTVINPEDGLPFTDPAAWDYVATVLAADIPELWVCYLDKYPGKVAYYTVVAVGGRDVYIKVRFGTKHIIGMSFHYSTEQRD